MSPLIEKIDLNPAFDSLSKVIQESSFGPMLAMVGGIEVLQPLRQPFLEKMRGSLTEISETNTFRDGVSQLILDHSKQENIHEKVSVIVKKRLEEQRDFPIARVRFNKENTMDCSLEARHIINDEEGNTICGFAFSMISATAQRYLDRLITEFQWEERHHKDLEEESLGDV